MAGNNVGERFAGLLLRYRGRTGLTQTQLASRIGAHPRSVQYWEAGVNYPSASRLQSIIAAFLSTGGLKSGDELADARSLWDAMLLEARRARAPFDSEWFGDLLERHKCSPDAGLPVAGVPAPLASDADRADMHREHWGDAPSAHGCVGRAGEMALLRDKVLRHQCRVVELFGMGGIGKTTLATRLAADLGPSFEIIHWRSLRSAPSASAWLGEAIAFAASGNTLLSEDENVRITALIELMRERRCLLVLDNLEAVLDPKECDGRFRDGCAGYGRLLRLVAETSHQSCVIVTSREASTDLGLVANGLVYSLELGGLSVGDARLALSEKRLTGTDVGWAELVARCGGNPLVLLMTAETIRQIFGGDVGAYLNAVGSNTTVDAGVRRLLASQLEEHISLTGLELLRVLAMTDGPLTLPALLAEVGPRFGHAAVIQALLTLRRRSVVIRCNSGAGLSLQPVVHEYVAGWLLDTAAA